MISQELRAKLLSGKKILIIDVRTKEEFQEVHIEGSFNIGLPEFSIARLEEKIATNEGIEAIVFVCRSGIRSKTAILSLGDYQSQYPIYNLKGGIMSWASLGYKIILDDEE